MTLLGRYKQQPGEKRKRALDYAEFLEATETISTVNVAITPVTATLFAVTSILIATDLKSFAYFIEGGETNNTYMAKFTVTTNIGQVIEDEVEFEVEDVT